MYWEGEEDKNVKRKIFNILMSDFSHINELTIGEIIECIDKMFDALHEDDSDE